MKVPAGTTGTLPSSLRLAPDYSTRIHRAYYTATDAAKAKVVHFAEVEGGYITTRQEIADLVTAEHAAKMHKQHKGKHKQNTTTLTNKANRVSRDKNMMP